MDFIEKLRALASNIEKRRALIQTEEATKTAFILPFIAALGFDIHDPSEVVPEFTADLGMKKGEKVDYAIFRDGKVIMLIECKPCTSALDDSHMNQLFRYFTVTDTRIGVLTDGVNYCFYSDIDERNKMDQKPFMEFNLLDFQDHQVADLKRLTKSAFNLDELLTAAGEMKYTREITRLIGQEISAPSEDFVKLFASKVYAGPLRQGVREQFCGIVKRAFTQFINNTINERLRSAMAATQTTTTEGTASATQEGAATPDSSESKVLTTEEELQAFLIVRAIMCEVCPIERIAFRDAQSYSSVLLDDNRLKPLCRFHFDMKQKKVGLFNEAKEEERFSLESLNDLFKYADRLKATYARHEAAKGQASRPSASTTAGNQNGGQ